jgi:hypothetical protein
MTSTIFLCIFWHSWSFEYMVQTQKVICQFNFSMLVNMYSFCLQIINYHLCTLWRENKGMGVCSSLDFMCDILSELYANSLSGCLCSSISEE